MKVSGLIFSALAALGVSQAANADLTIYTDRPSVRVQSIANDFKAATGENVVIKEMATTKIVELLETEGMTSPADVVFVKDLVYVADLQKKGLFQPMASKLVEDEIAPAMRDATGLWTAITIRGRTLMYDPSRVSASDLKGYEDLADAKWAGRLCVRTSKSSYNEALVAGLVATHGLAKAQTIVEGWVQNLAADPLPSDNAVLEAIANGVCDVGITNTYYLGQAIAKNPAFPVRPFFADQTSSGVYGNGTAAGIAVNSKQPALATQFIELMLSDKFQLELTEAQFDYPAKLGLLPTTLVKDWGFPKFNEAGWSVLGTHIQEAKKIMTDVGYN